MAPSHFEMSRRALSKCKVINNRKDITPLQAGWMLYAALGVNTSFYPEVLMWVSDRKFELTFNFCPGLDPGRPQNALPD